MPFEVWLSGWSAPLSPPPLQLSNPFLTKSSPERICIVGRYLSLIGQVKAVGLRAPLPMATVLRDSQGEDKLLHYTSPFSVSNSSHCIVIFFPLLLSSFVFSLWERGVGPTGGPHLQIALPPTSESTVDYSPFTLFLSVYHLLSCSYGHCHPIPESLRSVMNYSPPIHSCVLLVGNISECL